MTTAHTVNACTVTVFLTACSGNLLITSLGAKLFGYTVTWWEWFLAGALPGLLSMVIMPWFIYKIYPPEIKETPEAPAMAREELDKLGPITTMEKKVAAIFVGAILLWSTTTITGLHATVIAIMAVLACVISECLTWDDICFCEICQHYVRRYVLGVGSLDYFLSLCILSIFLRQWYRTYYCLIFCLRVYFNCLRSADSLCDFDVWLDE